MTSRLMNWCLDFAQYWRVHLVQRAFESQFSQKKNYGKTTLKGKMNSHKQLPKKPFVLELQGVTKDLLPHGG